MRQEGAASGSGVWGVYTLLAAYQLVDAPEAYEKGVFEIKTRIKSAIEHTHTHTQARSRSLSTTLRYKSMWISMRNTRCLHHKYAQQCGHTYKHKHTQGGLLARVCVCAANERRAQCIHTRGSYCIDYDYQFN